MIPKLETTWRVDQLPLAPLALPHPSRLLMHSEYILLKPPVAIGESCAYSLQKAWALTTRKLMRCEARLVNAV